MKIAINEAKSAKEKNFIPIGSIIVYKNKIIAKAHNEEFWHAEILCIQKAQKILGKYLNNCTIYSTIEPCPMCLYAIKLAKISTIIFGANKSNEQNNKLNIIENIEKKECEEIIKNFFQNKRNNLQK